MSYQIPFVTLKYAVEAVPFFDGNNIPLNYFIEGCEEAKSMLPEEVESQFTKIIRTRIIGEARRTIQDQFFSSVSQLTSYLKRIYGPSKDVYQLQGELGSIYQKDEEDVISYASRIKTLGKQISDAYQYLEKVLPDENIKMSLEKNMCECFIRGLKPNIEQRITRNVNIEDTIADALRIERELREIVNLRQKRGANSSQNELPYTKWLQETCQFCFKKGHIANNCRKLTQISPQIYNETNLETEILICQICKKRGHNANNCRLRNLRYRRSINIIREEVISCQLCSKSGHDAKSCLQNDINNQTNKIPVICQWCERPGHLAKNCWMKQNEEYNLKDKQQIICQICNNFGHTAKNCFSNVQSFLT